MNTEPRRITELLKSIDTQWKEIESIIENYKVPKFEMDLALVPITDDFNKEKWMSYFNELGIKWKDSSRHITFKYRGRVVEKDKMFIFLDGKELQINCFEFEFDSPVALTREEVQQRLEGTKDLLSISGDFKQ